MVKIFFPALGVYFSELCRLALPLCHNTVNKKNGGKWSQVRPALLHIILFISRLPIKKTTVFPKFVLIFPPFVTSAPVFYMTFTVIYFPFHAKKDKLCPCIPSAGD